MKRGRHAPRSSSTNPTLFRVANRVFHQKFGTGSVTAIDGNRFDGAMRDTVLVPPKMNVTVAFDANNPGWWALHCHLAYHQAAGMFATVRYV